jgi:hypothetical protein
VTRKEDVDLDRLNDAMEAVIVGDPDLEEVLAVDHHDVLVIIRCGGRCASRVGRVWATTHGPLASLGRSQYEPFFNWVLRESAPTSYEGLWCPRHSARGIDVADVRAALRTARTDKPSYIDCRHSAIA